MVPLSVRDDLLTYCDSLMLNTKLQINSDIAIEITIKFS